MKKLLSLLCGMGIITLTGTIINAIMVSKEDRDSFRYGK